MWKLQLPPQIPHWKKSSPPFLKIWLQAQPYICTSSCTSYRNGCEICKINEKMCFYNFGKWLHMSTIMASKKTYIYIWIDKGSGWNIFTLKILLVFSLITIYIYMNSLTFTLTWQVTNLIGTRYVSVNFQKIQTFLLLSAIF